MDSGERNHDEATGQAASRAMTPLHVLLAEDTRANQVFVSHVLRRRGHSLDVASNGQQTIEQIQNHDYDVVLMDVQMPVMDGFQATAAIRALEDRRKAGVPIIAMTAHAMSSDERQCLSAGMDAYISKPINSQALIELVEKIARDDKSSAKKPCQNRGKTSEQPIPPAPFEMASNDKPGDSPSASPPQTTVEMELAECFQLDVAVKKCFGKYRMFQEMVRCFFTEADDLVGQMRMDLDHNDAEKVYRTAHRLKNTVVYLAADAAVTATTEIEQAGIAGDLPSARAALERLVPEVELLKTALAPHRPAHDADPPV